LFATRKRKKKRKREKKDNMENLAGLFLVGVIVGAISLWWFSRPSENKPNKIDKKKDDVVTSVVDSSTESSALRRRKLPEGPPEEKKDSGPAPPAAVHLATSPETKSPSPSTEQTSSTLLPSQKKEATDRVSELSSTKEVPAATKPSSPLNEKKESKDETQVKPQEQEKDIKTRDELKRAQLEEEKRRKAEIEQQLEAELTKLKEQKKKALEEQKKLEEEETRKRQQEEERKLQEREKKEKEERDFNRELDEFVKIESDAPKSTPKAREKLCPIYSAQWEFKARSEREINLAPKDQIAVVKQDDGGWWRGKNLNTGLFGWFPSNYCIRTDSKLNVLVIPEPGMEHEEEEEFDEEEEQGEFLIGQLNFDCMNQKRREFGFRFPHKLFVFFFFFFSFTHSLQHQNQHKSVVQDQRTERPVEDTEWPLQ
jgi:chemotaxis protein histidine kinase CheA